MAAMMPRCLSVSVLLAVVRLQSVDIRNASHKPSGGVYMINCYDVSGNQSQDKLVIMKNDSYVGRACLRNDTLADNVNGALVVRCHGDLICP